MARADLLVKLIEATMYSDKNNIRKATEAIIAEERSKQHNILAENLENILNNSKENMIKNNDRLLNESGFNGLLYEIIPRRTINQLVLPKKAEKILKELIEEQHRSDLLRTYGLEPRNRILLIGPPGNGKTSLAEVLAESLMVPLFIVKYESVIGTFLGETANRLKKIFEQVSTRNCVLFFDEFETLGKERGDNHETGEIKRVVSSLLMQIDNLPSHVIVVAATNHPELLDRAVWRRFQVRIELPNPTRDNLAYWFKKFEKNNKISLSYSSETLAKYFLGYSFAEAEEFGQSILRQYILSQPSSNMREIIKNNLDSWLHGNAKIKQQNNNGEQK